MSCSICSLGLQGSNIRELPCKHIFHTNCINESVKYNTVCPYCRKEYPLIEHYLKNMNKENLSLHNFNSEILRIIN